jgi:hypothetical protein
MESFFDTFIEFVKKLIYHNAFTFGDSLLKTFFFGSAARRERSGWDFALHFSNAAVSIFDFDYLRKYTNNMLRFLIFD